MLMILKVQSCAQLNYVTKILERISSNTMVTFYNVSTKLLYISSSLEGPLPHEPPVGTNGLQETTL